MRLMDLEAEKRDLLLRLLSNNTANQKANEVKHTKLLSWPLLVSPLKKGRINAEEGVTVSDQIKSLGQNVLKRDVLIQEKQIVLEESMERMVKHISRHCNFVVEVAA